MLKRWYLLLPLVPIASVALAQASAPAAPDTTSFLLGQGVLGVACIGLSAAVIYLQKRNDRLQQDRIDDQKAFVTQRAADFDRMAGYLEKVTKALEDERRP